MGAASRRHATSLSGLVLGFKASTAVQSLSDVQANLILLGEYVHSPSHHIPGYYSLRLPATPK